MENERPYWKVIVSLTFSLLATILFVVVGWKLLRFFAPFVIGWLIACIAHPVVGWLEKHVKIVRKLGSALVIIVVLGGVIALLYFGIAKLVEEFGVWVNQLPMIYEEVAVEIQKIGNQISKLVEKIPDETAETWKNFMGTMEQKVGNWIGKMGEPTVEAAGNVAKKIPSAFIYTIVTIVSAYFFVAERDEVLQWVKKVTPKPIEDRMSMVTKNLKCAVGGYFKAQFQIMLVVASILCVGFLALGINYAILLAIVISFLDFLPFFGTGTAMIPWGIYEVVTGDYKRAIVLFVLYGVTQLIRQIIQPKLVGDNVGLKPLPTLMLLYVGYRFSGIFGMILAIPVGMILINMYQAGAFDYILDDVKILVKGILKLRE